MNLKDEQRKKSNAARPHKGFPFLLSFDIFLYVDAIPFFRCIRPRES